MTKYVNYILQKRKIKELYPWQKDIIENTDLLKGKNMIVNCPTGSGKTLVAEIIISKSILENRGKKKCLYLAPLRSLAFEKYKDWKKFGWSVGISVGDYSEKYEKLNERNVIVTTFEKFNSIISKKPEWLDEIDCIIVDEIHSLIEESRSAVLEHILMILKDNCQILGLSATIKNLDELANWLNADVYKGNIERPKNIDINIICKNKVYDSKLQVVNRVKDWKRLVVNKIREGKTVLVFTNKRKSCPDIAMKIMYELSKYVEPNGVDDELYDIFGEIVQYGIGFHFGIMDSKTRNIIETAFKEGRLKCLVATKTLAMGVNLPVDVVVIKDLVMFNKDKFEWMKTLDIWQMIGRAGRFGKGEAYLVIGNDYNLRKIYEDYICADYEKIMSRLSFSKQFPGLIIQSISILGGDGILEEEVVDYWNDSLFCYQYNSGREILQGKINELLERFEEYELIEITSRSGIRYINLTEIGRIVSGFCVDPEVIIAFLENIEKINENRSYIGMIDFLIRMGVIEPISGKKSELSKLVKEIFEVCDNSYLGNFAGYNEKQIVSIIKTIKLINEWISGKDVNISLINLDDIQRYISCFKVISKKLEYDELSIWLNNFSYMLKYGVPEDLTEMVKQRGVGRKKALRYLHMSNLTKYF